MVFQNAKENAEKRGVTSAPYLDIKPRDLRIDFPISDVAVVTFHLGDGESGTVGRRLFVLVKTKTGWKITHLHASSVNVKAPGRL